MLLRKISDFILDILEVVVFAIAIFLFIYLLVLQPHKIKGSSMEPNFPDGEFLLTDKLSYRFGEPERGDVVVFEAPGANGDEFIKRIIGLPNEQISIQEDGVYINGEKLNEDYLSPDLQIPSGMFLKENMTYTIPEGNYVVLGDNRPASSDSRAWGPIKLDKITGKAWVVYWPINDIRVVDHIDYNF